jgi:hypothetical protein
VCRVLPRLICSLGVCCLMLCRYLEASGCVGLCVNMCKVGLRRLLTCSYELLAHLKYAYTAVCYRALGYGWHSQSQGGGGGSIVMQATSEQQTRTINKNTCNHSFQSASCQSKQMSCCCC